MFVYAWTLPPKQAPEPPIHSVKAPGNQMRSASNGRASALRILSNSHCFPGDHLSVKKRVKPFTQYKEPY